MRFGPGDHPLRPRAPCSAARAVPCYGPGVPRRRPPADAPALFGAVADPVAAVDPAVALAAAVGGPIAGLDEAGRGPLAGPVVAACVVLPEPVPAALAALDDSKKLDEAAREALFPLVQRHALAWGIAFVEAADIDAMNILRASLRAMADAFAACEAQLARPVAGALIDGNQKAPLPTRVAQRTLIGGDGLARPIMAASILAKVARDRRMVEEHARWPAYGFDVHKGYPTPRHLQALAAHGPCPLHRRSFAPVRRVLQAATPDEVT
jgi:ribonuclease HII